MQDDDLKYLATHSNMSVMEIACKSIMEGGNLWRKLAANGLFDEADDRCLKELVFAALASPDMNVAREFMTQAFAGKDAHRLSVFFYRELIAHHSALRLCGPEMDEGLRLESLPVVLDVLEQCGVDLALRDGLKIEEEDEDVYWITYNGLHHVIDLIDDEKNQDQSRLIEVACAYLDKGVPLHDGAEGVEYSPLASLLDKNAHKGLDVLAIWAKELVSRGYIQEAHLHALNGIERVDPQALALFEACLARHSIMGISRAAQTLGA